MQIGNIQNIHHIHIWNLTDKLIHFESHINLKNDLTVSETKEILEVVRQILYDEFDVEHVTIQFGFVQENPEKCKCE